MFRLPLEAKILHPSIKHSTEMINPLKHPQTQFANGNESLPSCLSYICKANKQCKDVELEQYKRSECRRDG